MITSMIGVEDALANIELRFGRLQSLVQALIDFTGTDDRELKTFDICANQEHFKNLVALIEEYTDSINGDVIRLTCEIYENRATASQG